MKYLFYQKLLQEKISALKSEHPAKNEIYYSFSMFVGQFCPPGYGYGSRDPIEGNAFLPRSSVLPLSYVTSPPAEYFFHQLCKHEIF
jgi:hypothetical protein